MASDRSAAPGGIRQAQAVLQSLFESAIVDEIALLVVQSGEQLPLLLARWRHVFWVEGQVSVGIMEVLRVFEVHLENEALVVVVGHFPEGLLHVFDPAKSTVGQRLYHGPPIEVIYVEVQQVLQLLLRVVEIAHILFVGLGVRLEH